MKLKRYPAATRFGLILTAICVASAVLGVVTLAGLGVHPDLFAGVGLLVGAAIFGYQAIKVCWAIWRAPTAGPQAAADAVMTDQ